MFHSVGEGLSLWKKKLTPSILLVIVSQYSMKALAGFFYKENTVQQHRQVIHRLQVWSEEMLFISFYLNTPPPARLCFSSALWDTAAAAAIMRWSSRRRVICRIISRHELVHASNSTLDSHLSANCLTAPYRGCKPRVGASWNCNKTLCCATRGFPPKKVPKCKISTQNTTQWKFSGWGSAGMCFYGPRWLLWWF